MIQAMFSLVKRHVTPRENERGETIKGIIYYSFNFAISKTLFTFVPELRGN
jgi:hypothetical protein